MKTKGQLDQDLRQLLKVGIITAIIAILGVAAFAALSFFTIPFALSVIITALFAGSMAYLMGIGYGILNDLLGAKSNLAYFMLGHQPQQRSMIESNKEAAVGIAWGIAAVAPLAIPAGVLFAVTALIAGFFVPVPLFILPVMAVAIPLVVIIADVAARRKKQEMLDDKGSYAYYDWNNFYSGLSDYQIDNLKELSDTPEEKAAWFANSDRNVIGFTYMPILAGVALISMATLAGVSSFLPAVLFSTLIATVIPAAFGVVIALAITAALIYLAVNHNKQVDNRFKMDFAPETTANPTSTMDHEVFPKMDPEPTHFKSPVFQKSPQHEEESHLQSKDATPDYSAVLKRSGGSPLHQSQQDLDRTTEPYVGINENSLNISSI